MQLFYVHPDQVDPRTGARMLPALWPHIEHLVKRACERTRGGVTPESFRVAVETGQMQMWVVFDPKAEGPSRFKAIWGTELFEGLSGQKVCYIVICGGVDRRKWLHLLDLLEQWAKEEGCEKMRIFGRLGWIRDLKERQYKDVASVIEKDIQGE